MFGLKTKQENDRLKALIQEFEVRVGENNELFRALYQFVGAGLPLQRDSHLKEYVKEGYEGNPDLFSIISKLSGMFAGVPLNAMILKGNKYELAINPEVDRLMGRTNYYQTWNEFKRHWIISGYVTGNMITYAPKLTSGINAGKIDNDGLFVMPAQNVEILAGGWRKPIDKYVFDIDETYRIDTSNIWHERFLPTLNYEEGRNFMGMSPLKVAQHLINSQNKGYEMVSKMYNNLHPQSIVYKETDPGQGGETTAEQEAKFRERYKSKYSGINNFTVPIFTLGKIGVARIGYDNLQELQVINMSEHGRRVFCNILGVPAQLFNDTSASTYANVKEAQKAIYTNRIIPDINIFCDGFTILLKPYGDIILKPDFSGIDVLQEDKKEKSEWVSRLYNDGIITGDQYLEMMGQEPTGLPEMNVRYTNINRVPLGFEYTDEIERSNKFYFNHGLTEYGKSKIQIDQVDWREVYENAGADWINDLQPSQFAQEFAKQLVKERKKSILEVGCANGKDSILFALAGLNVTGIDIIPEVIEIARQNAEKVGLSIDFRVENVEELTFSDSSFDAVFSVSTLHSTDMNKSIPKISKVLKTKGLAFIYIYSDTQHINGQREEFVTLDEFIDLFKNNGFSIENLYTEQEEEYDNAGEKHNKIIVNARKE